MENTEYKETELAKERHGCVTSWLVFMIVANSLIGLVYMIVPESIAEQVPGKIPFYIFSILGLIGIANVVFSVALFKWKLWGFYGFIVTSLASFIINLLIGIDVVQSVLGLVGIAFLYGVLQIKKNNISAWNYLE
jgi:hypothetical protein